jgi:hypothetical protein
MLFTGFFIFELLCIILVIKSLKSGVYVTLMARGNLHHHISSAHLSPGLGNVGLPDSTLEHNGKCFSA